MLHKNHQVEFSVEHNMFQVQDLPREIDAILIANPKYGALQSSAEWPKTF